MKVEERFMKKVFIEVLERYEESNKIYLARVIESERKLFTVGEEIDQFIIDLHEGIVEFYEKVEQGFKKEIENE